MTIHCEGAKAAEVIFSLTGGREGRVFSENPPVEIQIIKDCIFLELIRPETRYKNIWNPKYEMSGEILQIKPLFSNYIKIGLNQSIEIQGRESLKDSVYWFPHEYSIDRITNYLDPEASRENLYHYTDNSTREKVGHYFNLYVKINNLSRGASMFFFGYSYEFCSYEELKSLVYKNALVISDTTGVIYAQEYPKGMKPTYKVNCITCPPGLCACRGKGEKIHCVDCRKVVNGLNNASRGIDAVYG